MNKKLFAAETIFATAFALRIMGDEGGSTMPDGLALEDPSTTGDFPDAGEQDSWQPDVPDGYEIQEVDTKLHVSGINGEPTDDWLTVDLVIMPSQDWDDDHDTPDPRQGGYCNNIGANRHIYEGDGEIFDDIDQFCMDMCIASGGSIETVIEEREGYFSSEDKCKIDKETCAEGYWIENTILQDGSSCAYSCKLAGLTVNEGGLWCTEAEEGDCLYPFYDPFREEMACDDWCQPNAGIFYPEDWACLYENMVYE